MRKPQSMTTKGKDLCIKTKENTPEVGESLPMRQRLSTFYRAVFFCRHALFIYLFFAKYRF